MKKRQTKAQIFRETATDEQWKELVSDHSEMQSEKDFFAKYGFTFGAVRNDLVEKGLYKNMRNVNTGQHVANSSPRTKVFLVPSPDPDIEKIARSVQLNKDVYDRLKVLEKKHGQYTHYAILNQLLDDSLKLYGF